MKKTWEGINNLINCKKKSNKCINALKRPNNEGLSHKPSKISNIFNNHFASIGHKLASNVPNISVPFTDYLPTTNMSGSFVFDPTSPHEIELEIIQTPLNKAYGLYSCPTRILRCARYIISQPLSDIINNSVSQGIYPSKLKHAKVIPIYKGEDDTDPGNYRPISLLSIFNRIFEKIMYNRLKQFFDKYDVLYKSQYGFRKKHSTQHALLDIVSQVQLNMDRGLFSCGIFIDLKKAFDTVDHSILLGKLHHYGIRGVIHDWFSSYLTDRTQVTQIGHNNSDKVNTLCGVPQGSVLGPLLFLIYINDIYNSSDKLSFYLFADDKNLLYADKNLKSLEAVVDTELAKIYNWLTANKLSLNLKKSNFVIFHQYQKRINYQVNLKIFDHNTNSFFSLECKDYIKYLGVLIDSNLTWKYHISHVASKVSKTIGIIARLRHFIPMSALLHIYRSLVLPYLSYGLVAWGQAAQTHLNKIFTLQKRALRLMHFAQYRSHATPFFIASNVIPLNMLYFKSVSILMHDVYNNMAPSNISDLFTSLKEIHSHDTRSSSHGSFYAKHSRLNQQRNSFSRIGVNIWNSIPAELRKLPKNNFKTKLHKLLLQVLKNEDVYVDVPTLMKTMANW